MSENTGISWCDATFNPWWGCTKVSPACDHCYAERDARRFAPGKTLWGVGAERRTFGDAHWQMPLRWAKTLPAKLGRRPRVFCASMGDVFDKDAPEVERARLFRLIAETPELDWLLLTKRIGNVHRLAPPEWVAAPPAREIPRWPHNVWLGITVVNQEEADRDIPKLLELPASVRFLSVEPMLGPVDVFSSITGELLHVSGNEFDPGCIDWVICGGESGPSARPMHPEWVSKLRRQCGNAGVPFHFKQWGEWAPGICPGDDLNARTVFMTVEGALAAYPTRPEGTQSRVMSRVGTKAAGRELDGRTFDGFPA
jgi:protein gp37